ncbi:MAG: STAS domain-containing protein, partial [Candidatus Acidiferrum sp.]
RLQACRCSASTLRLFSFNAPFFKQEAPTAANSAGLELKWFVLDMIPVTMIDVTGLYAVDEVINALRARGVLFVGAGG